MDGSQTGWGMARSMGEALRRRAVGIVCAEGAAVLCYGILAFQGGPRMLLWLAETWPLLVVTVVVAAISSVTAALVTVLWLIAAVRLGDSIHWPGDLVAFVARGLLGALLVGVVVALVGWRKSAVARTRAAKGSGLRGAVETFGDPTRPDGATGASADSQRAGSGEVSAPQRPAAELPADYREQVELFRDRVSRQLPSILTGRASGVFRGVKVQVWKDGSQTHNHMIEFNNIQVHVHIDEHGNVASAQVVPLGIDRNTYSGIEHFLRGDEGALIMHYYVERSRTTPGGAPPPTERA